MATVTLENLRKSFGRTEVIHGVDIDIADGEFIVIVGPSGCGKSTLLRMVAGLETVTSGEVRIGGRRMNEVEPMDRDIAMVFQNYALYPHMSVFDNMAYGLKIAKVPRAEIRARVHAAAEILQLEPYLKRRPRELSGGQRQRVAMGRAIVREPAVFLFDEPLSNLDAKLRVQMRLEIKALQRKLGVTSLYVTHDQVEAMTLADRMMVMNAGHVDQIGPPLEVYANPATAFVAGFIGSPPMNFFDAARFGAAANGARLGIRPEFLRIVPEPDGRIAGIVTSAEPLGAETLIHLVTSQGDSVTVRRDGHEPIPAEGTRLGLAWNDEQAHRFAETGRRIPAG
ncbi:ABC transporter ATP-binding protein [Tropicimonas sp.]|uniref:ABC transporter ATP-binding protein n=1 Tax=Tropicimonas sp. TaxID=2067044 RepID=UPI003A898ED4